MTHFGDYFKLFEHLGDTSDSKKDLNARLLELGHVIRHDGRLEPWQRTVLLEQLFLLHHPVQRSTEEPNTILSVEVPPKLSHLSLVK